VVTTTACVARGEERRGGDFRGDAYIRDPSTDDVKTLCVETWDAR
jgi:hypothetical protein